MHRDAAAAREPPGSDGPREARGARAVEGSGAARLDPHAADRGAAAAAAGRGTARAAAEPAQDLEQRPLHHRFLQLHAGFAFLFLARDRL